MNATDAIWETRSSASQRPVRAIEGSSGGCAGLRRALLAPLFLLVGFAAFQEINAGSPSVQSARTTAPDFTAGLVKKLDVDRGLVTLKHGPIESMGMPDMTMIFRLANPEQMQGLKVGDHVVFRVEKIRGSLVVVELSSSSRAMQPGLGHPGAGSSGP